MTTAPARTRNRRTSPIEFEKHAAERRQWPPHYRMTKAENDLFERHIRAVLRHDRDMGKKEVAAKLGVDEGRVKRSDGWMNRYQKNNAAKNAPPSDPFEDKYTDNLTHGHEYDPVQEESADSWGATGAECSDDWQAVACRGDDQASRIGEAAKAPDRALVNEHESQFDNFLEGFSARQKEADDKAAEATADDAETRKRDSRASAAADEAARMLADKKRKAAEYRRKRELRKAIASHRKCARESGCPIDGHPWIPPRASAVMSRMLNRSKDAK